MNLIWAIVASFFFLHCISIYKNSQFENCFLCITVLLFEHLPYWAKKEPIVSVTDTAGSLDG